MSVSGQSTEQSVRERAYLIWQEEGQPLGRAEDHWLRALNEIHGLRTDDEEPMLDEEKILAGRSDVNLPALLTKDVLGG
jgi:hypothetical protein